MKLTPAITAQARLLVREHTLLSAASALIPNPILCTTAVTAVHVRLLSELSELYQKPFNARVVRVYVIAAAGGALTGGVLSQPLVRRALAGLAPLLLPACCIGGSILAGSLTRFLGRAIIRHYESGGTYQNFDWEEFGREVRGKLGLTRLKGKLDAGLKPA